MLLGSGQESLVVVSPNSLSSRPSSNAQRVVLKEIVERPFLHPSDDLVLEYLDAVHDREVEVIPRLQFEVLHYAELQEPQSCFKEHVVELEKFEVLKDREVRCLSSSAASLLPLALLSSLL